jgi:hypothetical protein
VLGVRGRGLGAGDLGFQFLELPHALGVFLGALLVQFRTVIGGNPLNAVGAGEGLEGLVDRLKSLATLCTVFSVSHMRWRKTLQSSTEGVVWVMPKESV